MRVVFEWHGVLSLVSFWAFSGVTVVGLYILLGVWPFPPVYYFWYEHCVTTHNDIP